MTEKKATKAAAKTAVKKAPAKKAVVKKSAKEAVALNSTNVGYKAGDVYQTLAAEGKALTAEEIAKAANISTEEAYLGIGWLFKEGKIKDEDNKVTLA